VTLIAATALLLHRTRPAGVAACRVVTVLCWTPSFTLERISPRRLVSALLLYGVAQHIFPYVPPQDLEQAYKECGQADLIVCLGSSLTVSPANDLPKKVAQHGGELVIVNLQRTPLDNMRFVDFLCVSVLCMCSWHVYCMHSTLRIHGRTDEVMIGVMQELGLEIPPFVLNRLVRVQHSKQSLLGVVFFFSVPLSNISFTGFHTQSKLSMWMAHPALCSGPSR